MNSPETPSESDPRPVVLGQILSDLNQVLDHQTDGARKADAEVKRLDYEVDELRDAVDGMTEANLKGAANHDLSTVREATLEAISEREKAKRRHPSNPKK